MSDQRLTLTFPLTVEADIPALTAVMTRAFDDAARKQRGHERGGPPGYDNGDFFRQWLFGSRNSIGYNIVLAGRIVGGAIVWIYPHGHNWLGTIFIDPAYQDQGIATRTWQFLEDRYPATRDWTLETPVWALKNHHFYEKCGFRRLRVAGDFIVYGKPMISA
jgi:GNAT superfamily N-acetyltransferase